MFRVSVQVLALMEQAWGSEVGLTVWVLEGFREGVELGFRGRIRAGRV